MQLDFRWMLILFCAAIPFTTSLASAQTTVYADQWGAGFNTTDVTATLQGAIDSGADTVIVRDMGSPWHVTPIQLRSDQKIVFESGAEVRAKRGAFQGVNDRLFSANGVSNLTLEGYGATFRMWKSDYSDPLQYQHSEGRHALWIRESSGITIKGLAFKDSGGDGIYLGAGLSPVDEVLIQDVLADNNYRQGMSISNATDVLVTGSTFRTTSGTAPEAGIDLEPSRPHHRLSNIVITDSTIEHNAGYGLAVSTQHLVAQEGSQPVTATFRNLNIQKIAGPGIYLYLGSDASVDTHLTFENVRVWDTHGEGLLVRQKSKDHGTLSFEGLQLDDVANLADYPILLEDIEQNSDGDPFPETAAFGGIDFGTEAGIGSLPSEIVDDMDRPGIAIAGYLDDASSNGLWDVAGQLYIDNPYGAWGELGSNLHNVSLQIYAGQAPLPAPEPTTTALFTGAAALVLTKRRRS